MRFSYIVRYFFFFRFKNIQRKYRFRAMKVGAYSRIQKGLNTLIHPKKKERKQEKKKPIGHDYRIQRAFRISMQLSYPAIEGTSR